MARRRIPPAEAALRDLAGGSHAHATEGSGRRQPRRLTCIECSAEFRSIGSYLGRRPLCPCHRSSPRRRRSKPQTAAVPSDATVLSALPPDVIHAIVLACDGVASLAWCGSCKHFRACRPPLRVLVVGRAGGVDIRESHPELRHLMAVHVSAGKGARAHSCIDALPAALAAEVTHPNPNPNPNPKPKPKPNPNPNPKPKPKPKPKPDPNQVTGFENLLARQKKQAATPYP